MKRVNSMSRPNSHIFLYFALYVILTFLMFGCGSSSGGSGSDAAASDDTGSIAVSLEFQDNFEEISEFQAVQKAEAEFNCVDNGVGWVEIQVLDENGETLATAGAECEVGEATCTGVKAGSNRKVIAFAKPDRNSEVILYRGETTEPITVTAGETYYTETITLVRLNQAPVSIPGPDQKANVGDTVTLDGSNSYDPDGFIASSLWTQISGPTVTLSSPTSLKTTFTAPAVPAGGASLTFRLTVADNEYLQAKDSCIVNVEGVAPIANAGPDQNVKEGDTVILDGSNSEDPDGFIASSLWTQISGPTVTLSSPTSLTTTFTAPVVPEKGASFTFRLTVTDNDGLQVTDSCIVNVGDILPPIADAGPIQKVNVSASVTLDGSNSYDPDGFIKSYLWTQTSGPTVKLSSTTVDKPTFTAPAVAASLTFQLTVTDNDGLQATDSCIVNVAGVPPIANAGPDQTVKEGDTVTLDGSNSEDPDGSIESYLWTQISGPTVKLSNTTVDKPTFTAPAVGEGGASLKFQLTVTDNDGLQATDECLVDVLDVISGNKFEITTIDSTINYMGTSIAVSPNDAVYICYYEPPDNPGRFVYATKYSGKWQPSVLVDLAGDSGGYYYHPKACDVAVDSNGGYHFAYYDGRDDSLVYVPPDYQVSGGLEIVDKSIGLDSISIVVDSAGTPHILYGKISNYFIHNLIYAKRTGQNEWERTILFTVPSYTGNVVGASIALDSTGKVHVTYSYAGLNYVSNVNGYWKTENLGTFERLYTDESSIAVDSKNRVHISFSASDAGNPGPSTIYYLTNASGDWDYNALTWPHRYKPSGSSVALDTSIALDSSDNVHIVCYDSYAVRYFTNANSSDPWVFSNTFLEYTWAYVAYPSIALDKYDYAHISYINETTGELKYATNAPEF